MTNRIEVINKTLALLEKQAPEKFRMYRFMRLAIDASPDQFKGTGECLTCACIGGWVVAANCKIESVLSSDHVFLENSTYMRAIGDEAQVLLELEAKEARDLFYMEAVKDQTFADLAIRFNLQIGDCCSVDAFDRFPAVFRKIAAVEVLTHLRDTGQVDWCGAMWHAFEKYKTSQR